MFDSYLDMNQQIKINDAKTSCRAQLSNLVALPPGLEISNLQTSEQGYDSNHTTPLNYMQKFTPTTRIRLSQQSAVYNEIEKRRDFEVERNFHGWPLNSLSEQDNFPELNESNNHLSHAFHSGSLALRETVLENESNRDDTVQVKIGFTKHTS